MKSGLIFHLAEGQQQFIGTKVFAGYTTSNPLNESLTIWLTDNYGGKDYRWQHAKGICYIEDSGETVKAEVHWFQEKTVGKVRLIVKEWLE